MKWALPVLCEVKFLRIPICQPTKSNQISCNRRKSCVLIWPCWHLVADLEWGAKAQSEGRKDGGCSPKHGKHTEIKMLDILFSWYSYFLSYQNPFQATTSGVSLPVVPIKTNAFPSLPCSPGRHRPADPEAAWGLKWIGTSAQWENSTRLSFDLTLDTWHILTLIGKEGDDSDSFIAAKVLATWPKPIPHAIPKSPSGARLTVCSIGECW